MEPTSSTQGVEEFPVEPTSSTQEGEEFPVEPTSSTQGVEELPAPSEQTLEDSYIQDDIVPLFDEEEVTNQTETKECSQTFSLASPVEIRSPRYPEPYPNDLRYFLQ